MRKCYVTFWGCIFFALLILTVPLPWAAAAAAAGAFHELSHVLAIYALKGKILSLQVGFPGAKIRIGPMPFWKEALAAAAGPAGSFLLLLFLRRFPRIALCGLVQGAFNLLPIYPMDGGRILYCLFSCFLPQDRAWIFTRRTGVFLLSILFLLILRLPGHWGSLLVLSLILPIIHVKIPCKAPDFRVQ